MVERVVDVRTIVVTNEVEALILEANLIKRHQPPFNVRLRDDKRYPYLKVTNEPFPRVVFTRVVRRRRRALLRSVHERSRPARADRSRSARVSAAHLPRTDRRQTQAPVPAVPHQALPRALRRLSDRKKSTTRRSTRSCCSSKANRSRCSRGCSTRWRRPPNTTTSKPPRGLRDRIVAGAPRHRRAEGRVAFAHRHGPHRRRARARSGLHASLHGARRQTDRPGALHPRRRATISPMPC